MRIIKPVTTMKRRIFINGLSSFSIGLTMLVSIPVILNILDTKAWVMLSTYQAVGLICSIFISFGWSVYGPQRVRSFSDSEIFHEYKKSLKMQLALTSILSGLFLTFLATMTSHGNLLNFLSFFSIAVIGARPNWLYIGLDLQFDNLKRETMPRLVLNVLGLSLMLLSEKVTLFFLCQSLGTLISIFLTTMWLKRRSSFNLESEPFSLQLIKEGVLVAFPPILNAMTSFAPLFILQFYSIEKAALMAFLLRLRMQYLTFASPVTDSMISLKLVRDAGSETKRNPNIFFEYLKLASIPVLAFPLFAYGIAIFVEQPEIAFTNVELLLFALYVGSFYAWNIAYSTESASANKARLQYLSICSFAGMVLAIFLGLQFSTLAQTFFLMFTIQIITFFLFIKFKNN